MDYYQKYIKYKLKYLNLVGKGKENEIYTVLNERDTRLSTLLNMFTTESIYELAHISDDSSLLSTISTIPTVKSKKFPKRLETRSQMTNHSSNSYKSTEIGNDIDIDIDKEKQGKKRKKEALEQESDFVQTRYNLRDVKFELRKETDTEIRGSYTPEIKKKLRSSGLDSKAVDKLVKLFRQDDKEIVEQAEKDDEAYIDLANNGKVIECWIADNMNCPCCKSKSLRRYVRDNMPCIDLICINPSHKLTDGVKFFQVKAKLKGITWTPHQNFNYNLKQIHTGSKAIGQYIHNITFNDEYNLLLFGYICIEYDKIIKPYGEFIKILSSSFIVFPKIKKIATVLFTETDEYPEKELIGEFFPYRDYGDIQKDNLFYWYIDSNPKNKQIEFNVNNNEIIQFNTINKEILFGPDYPITFSTNYGSNPDTWKIIPNPFTLEK